MTIKLPDPDQVKSAREARERADQIAGEYQELNARESSLISKYEEADAGGAGLEELKELESQIATVERQLELKERTLAKADREAAAAREEAQEKTKAAAAKEGKAIIKRILAAADELQAAQGEYEALALELRQKVVFKNLNVDCDKNYCGPDPGFIFNSQDHKFIGWEETARRFISGKPARDHKPQDDRPQLAPAAGLYLT